MVMSLAPLLADVDWIRIVILIVFLLGPLLSQMGKQKKRPEPGARREPRRPEPARKPKEGGGAKGLEAEIERMLREITGEQPRRPVKRPQRVRTTSSPATATQSPTRTRDSDIDPEAKKRLRQSVAQHVQEHLDAHPPTEHAQTLARTIEASDERVEKHLETAFRHQLGQLEKQASTLPQDAGLIAEGTDAAVWTRSLSAEAAAHSQSQSQLILNLLRNRENLRDAFIMSEILRPPVFVDRPEM